MALLTCRILSHVVVVALSIPAASLDEAQPPPAPVCPDSSPDEGPYARSSAHTARAEELLQLGDFRGAFELWRRAAELLRREDLDHDTDAAHPLLNGSAEYQDINFRAVSRVKLRHDAEQLEHLIARGILSNASHGRLANLYRRLLKELPDAQDAGRMDIRQIMHPPPHDPSSDRREIGGMGLLMRGLNRAAHLWWPHEAPANSTLSKDANWKAVQQNFLSNGSIVVVENALSQETLMALREWCETSTMWFKTRSAYLGAFLREGFSAPLLLQVAQELRAAMPELLGQYPLAQAWGFKYSNVPEDWDMADSGIGLHADQGMISINLWLTEDEANLDPASGGLTVFDTAAPPHFSGADYNRMQFRERNEALVRSGPRYDVPYRCNRMVIFRSRLFHKTMPIHFRPGYKSRRINLTLAFMDPKTKFKVPRNPAQVSGGSLH